MTERKTGLAALDIDQTLAGDIVGAHIRFYNAQLGLGLSEAQIQLYGRTYKKTFDVPEIIAYRKEHEDTFQQVRALVRSSEQVNRDFELIEGAQQAVGLLAQVFARLEYFTVRPQDTREVTTAWLAHKRLPNSRTVHISGSHREKLQQIDTVTRKDEPAILIDDSIEPLVQELAQLPGSEGKALRQRLGLIGFGERDSGSQAEISDYAQAYSVRISFLPRWDLVFLQEVLKQNEKKEKEQDV